MSTLSSVINSQLFYEFLRVNSQERESDELLLSGEGKHGSEYD
jgi:hypothetical protein